MFYIAFIEKNQLQISHFPFMMPLD